MKVYIDTSIVLRHLFNEDGLWKHWGKWDDAYASELMGVEARRCIDRLRLTNALDDEGVAAAHRELDAIEKTISSVACTRVTFQRAALPMPTVVKTLDALHLASALLLRESGTALIFATHDEKLARAAAALSFEVSGF